MNAEGGVPGFLKLDELLKFLEFGPTGLIAMVIVLMAFMIFIVIFRPAVKKETMQLFRMFFSMIGVLVVALFVLTYIAEDSLVGKVEAEIDTTKDRIEALTKQIEGLEITDNSADTRARLENARAVLNSKLGELQRITGAGAGYDLLKDERPYKGMPTPERLIAIAKSRLGTKWAYGKRAQLTNKAYQGPWDNSEFMGWVVFQAIGEVIGCEPPDPGLADCYTGFWGGEPEEFGLEKTVAWGLAYEGAILVRLPAPNAGRAGKVGISLGDGTFIESNGVNEVVQISEPQPPEFWDLAVQLY